ncbi:MAG TPA: clostripain-related cysteine peptidase [Thermoplasmata archaeon]
MTRRLVGIVAALVIAMPSLFLAAPASAEVVPDMWTVMVYMDGDNNLEDATVVDLGEMMVAGSTADVNIVVLVDTLAGPADLVYVNQGSTTTLAAWGEVNMGDPATLQAFITQAAALYPADKYVLDFWDHGGGIMGVCWDDTSSSDKLTMPELRTAIVGAGVAIDVVLFDACDMAQAEVAHQFQGYADYMVFSQETMWGQGFPYDTIGTRLVANPSMDARSFALIVGEEFITFYTALGWNTCTISVYDMSYLTSISTTVGTLASAMKATMSASYKTYKSCRLSAADAANAVDLMGFAQLVSANTKLSTTVRSAAGAVVTAVDQAIIFEWHSDDCNGMNGLGIWFPVSSVSYYWSASMETMYRSMPFDVATHWADFLDSYYAKV